MGRRAGPPRPLCCSEVTQSRSTCRSIPAARAAASRLMPPSALANAISRAATRPSPSCRAKRPHHYVYPDRQRRSHRHTLRIFGGHRITLARRSHTGGSNSRAGYQLSRLGALQPLAVRRQRAGNDPRDTRRHAKPVLHITPWGKATITPYNVIYPQGTPRHPWGKAAQPWGKATRTESSRGVKRPSTISKSIYLFLLTGVAKPHIAEGPRNMQVELASRRCR